MGRLSEARQAKLIARQRSYLSSLAGDRGDRQALEVPDPVRWYQGITGRVLDPWQAEVMRSTAMRVLLLCGRQVGKTEVVSAKAAHRALFLGRRVGVLSPTLRQSQIVYRRAKRLLLLADATLSRDTRSELEMPHGGAVIAFPGDNPDQAVRGETLSDLIVDEAGLIRDATIAAAAPTLSTVADHLEVHLGTPKGQRGEFYNEWRSGDDWERYKVTSQECPRISPVFLARMRRRLGPLYAQEFECEFLSAPGALFAADDLEAMFSLPTPEGVELLDAPRETELRF